MRFIDEHSVRSYNFHGCMLGVVDHEGTPIKKPCAVATSLCEIGWNCPNTNVMDLTSACKKGKITKKLRVFSFLFADSVRMEFDRAARSARTCALAISPSFSFSVRSVTVASSAPAGVCLPEERGN